MPRIAWDKTRRNSSDITLDNRIVVQFKFNPLAVTILSSRRRDSLRSIINYDDYALNDKLNTFWIVDLLISECWISKIKIKILIEI